MRKRGLFILLVAAFLFLARNIFAQESVEIPPVEKEPQIEWVWGEIVSVDKAQSTLIVKYYDYDEDREKEISIVIGQDTKYENLESFDKLKAGDTVSIDYIVTEKGVNLAKVINLEESLGYSPLSQ